MNECEKERERETFFDRRRNEEEKRRKWRHLYIKEEERIKFFSNHYCIVYTFGTE
jgi:hypothetical protein